MRARRTNCGGSSPSEKDPPANHPRGVCMNCSQFSVHGACEHYYAALHVTELASFDSRRSHQACFKCCGLKLHNNESAFAKMADDASEPEPTHGAWPANLQWPEILEELRRRYCSRNLLLCILHFGTPVCQSHQTGSLNCRALCLQVHGSSGILPKSTPIRRWFFFCPELRNTACLGSIGIYTAQLYRFQISQWERCFFSWLNWLNFNRSKMYISKN